VEISVIIPVFNESESLKSLHQAISSVLNASPDTTWETVYVDDGSTDDSFNVLQELAEEDANHVTIVGLRRNLGQTTAISAGLDHAQGEIIVLIDADMQNDPSDIPLMVEKINQGYDVVSGWRKNRNDNFITRTLPSRIANSIISFVTGVKLHDYGCTLKAYRREILSGFRLYGEMHRFIPAYASSVGAKMIEIPVRHHPRRYGKTNYGLGRTFKVILDLFTVKFLISYAQNPIYLFGGAGMVLLGLSLISLLIIIIRRLTLDEHLIRSPLLLMSTMLFILGTQSILLGLLAEQLMRTYHESQHKPTYSIKKIIKKEKQRDD
jgi:glycosyltransferase involved in cell wall biosynthesis